MSNSETTNHEDLKVSDLLVAAFQTAFVREPELHEAWVKLSHKLGSRIAVGSILTIQFLGQLDLLLRTMEAERQSSSDTLPIGPDFTLSYQIFLSEAWISSAYEIFRILESRDDTNERVANLYHSLRLLRIPIDKFQIAQDR